MCLLIDHFTQTSCQSLELLQLVHRNRVNTSRFWKIWRRDSAVVSGDETPLSFSLPSLFHTDEWVSLSFEKHTHRANTKRLKKNLQHMQNCVYSEKHVYSKSLFTATVLECEMLCIESQRITPKH